MYNPSDVTYDRLMQFAFHHFPAFDAKQLGKVVKVLGLIVADEARRAERAGMEAGWDAASDFTRQCVEEQRDVLRSQLKGNTN